MTQTAGGDFLLIQWLSPYIIADMWDFVYISNIVSARVGVRIAMESCDFTSHFNLPTMAMKGGEMADTLRIGGSIPG